ncbi:MAG: hypothetical protein A2Z72_01870 [Omnitrophica bacterium RBG_13_46_9]|nr:MAG: hypothetical protein A2Z72_01870 [Omnitrophica bacterium RBG_13_46_9]
MGKRKEAKILIVYHTQNGNTKKLADAVRKGASSVKGTKVVLKRAAKATLGDLLYCDGIAFGTPDYFSYMAGMLKDFFDRTCYPSEGKVTGKPYVAFVSHGGGGKAVESVERLCHRFKLKKIAPPLLAEGVPTKMVLGGAYELGKKLAEKVKR